jgi:DNA-binding response OmpR family regulator
MDISYVGDRRLRRRRGPGVRGSDTVGARLTPFNEIGAGLDRARPLRVAVLDRDSGFLVVLAKRLERAGMEQLPTPPKLTAKAVAAMDVDTVIVDVAILGERRWTWLARVCELNPDLGVIVCTGSSTAAERVRALRLGVDDWLNKPCHPEELIARVEAINSSRHPHELASLEPLIVGEVEIRPDQYQAFVGDRSLELTRREYQLMVLLSRSGAEAQPREQIYECLWGYEMARNDRSVDVFVHKLRRKLELASPDWRYIHTDFGVGYRLAAQALADSRAPAADTALVETIAEERIAA